jgi:protein gp37
VADQSTIEWTDATWNAVSGCAEMTPDPNRGLGVLHVSRTPSAESTFARFRRY